MTPQSTHKIIKAQLPEPYYTLIQKYVRKNKTAVNLADALRLTLPWHPDSTDEGYYFWEAVYHWSLGKRKKLPKINWEQQSKYSFSYSSRHKLCTIETNKAASVIEELFGKIGINRGNAATGEFNVYKRYILFTHLLADINTMFTLEMIGEVVAKQIGRKDSYDHCTILHARKMDDSLMKTNEPTYTNMKRLFKIRYDELYSTENEVES